jgi:hypothetical protein
VQGDRKPRRHWIALVVGFVVLAIPASATSATQIGQTFPVTATGDHYGCSSDVTQFATVAPGVNEYAAPADGVLTSWSYYAGATTSRMKFRVARPAGANDFTVVGGDSEFRLPTANVLNTYLIRIPVRVGDVIGHYNEFSLNNCFQGSPGYAIHYRNGDQQPGATATYTTLSPRRFNLSATLEADCDGDGFGDETQDPAVDPVACDTTAAYTTITARPKNRTKKKKATFKFSATEPGSSFECSLDGSGFAPCASPHTVKVRPGKHTFKVRAIDQAGNVGAPAKDSWKRKKKSKK